jgi:hypothetical protein
MNEPITVSETITRHAIIDKPSTACTSHNSSSNIMQIIGVMLRDKGTHKFTDAPANHSRVNVTFMLSKNGQPCDIIKQTQIIPNDLWLHAHDMLILSTIVLANAHETQPEPFTAAEFSEIQALGDEPLETVFFDITVTATVISTPLYFRQP